ncbi:MAG: helix-turn-helix domain-containing protein [Lachnospiraceae bacterium]|nr:helix-turn-helix domain-containing protein [Lachnospiraceae bacterium]
MQNKLEIGQRIRLLREAHGYSREQLAEILNVSSRFCYDLELGNKGMSVDTLSDLAEALNISTDYLLFGSSSKSETTDNKTDIEAFDALIKSCPENKRGYLMNIITCYLQAIRES